MENKIDYLLRLDGETADDTLYRVGQLKKAGELEETWEDIAEALNGQYDITHNESWWRKRFKSLCRMTENDIPLQFDTELDADMKQNVRDIEKQRMRLKDENNVTRKQLRNEAIWDNFIDVITEQISKIKLPEIIVNEAQDNSGERAIYALLSDIHYGLSFKSFYNSYSPEIATERVNRYASEIIRIADQNDVKVCYVSLMGDLISGSNHQSIRMQNAYDVAAQMTGAIELIETFLLRLAKHFKEVHVNSVAGNHSRIEPNFENAMRTERMDDVVAYMCNRILEQVSNVTFHANDMDPTFAMFDIYGNNYLSVHGDYDVNKDSIGRLKEAIDLPINYVLSAHKHVAEMRFENTKYIQNGSVVSGGDEYSTKKRLFGPAYQVAMICTPKGVEALCPVSL